jgi:hypothetical protein
MSLILKLSGSALDEYFREQQSRLIKHTRNHEWHKPKGLPWLTYCDECGLIWANNKNTMKRVKQGCVFYRLKEY